MKKLICQVFNLGMFTLCIFFLVGFSEVDTNKYFVSHPNHTAELFFELDELNDTNSTVVFFKEGAEFGEFRSAGIQVSGNFNNDNPQIKLNQIELFDEYNGHFHTLSNRSRDEIKNAFINGESVSLSLYGRDSSIESYSNIIFKFPKPMAVEARGSEQIIESSRFKSNSLLKWEPDITSSDEVTIVISPKSIVDYFWEIDLLNDNDDYNVIRTLDDGLYQLSNLDFKGIQAGKTMSIAVFRRNQIIYENENGSVNKIIALTATTGNYTLVK